MGVDIGKERSGFHSCDLTNLLAELFPPLRNQCLAHPLDHLDPVLALGQLALGRGQYPLQPAETDITHDASPNILRPSTHALLLALNASTTSRAFAFAAR